MKSRLIFLLAALLTVDLALAQPGQQTSTPKTVPGGGGQYRGPGDLIPPNGPPGAGNCFDVQPTACVLPIIAGVDAGCPDPAIAVEHHLSMYWEEPSPWSSWDCIQHPEGQYKGQVTRAELEAACTTARATLSGPPMVDFVVDALTPMRSLYAYPHAALREYCVTHLSHMGPEQTECNPNYDQPLSKPHLTQWPVTGSPPKTLPHLATEVTRQNFLSYYGFWDDPGTGELDDYLTVNRHCAEDPTLGTDPEIDGGRFRFHCDCQEGALAAIDSANPGWLNGGDIVYWFFAAP